MEKILNWFKSHKILGGIIIGVFAIMLIGSLGSESDNNENKEKLENNKKQVTVIAFSEMSIEEITTWCDENNVECYKKTEYSDSIAKDDFISQSVNAGDKITEGKAINIIYSLGKEPTLSQKNAVKKTNQYLDTMAFSRSGLIKQLEFEGYSKEDSTYGVDNVTVDWDEQAVKKAQQYLDTMAFSRSGLIKQLEFEGFTNAQATHGVDEVGL